MMHLSQMAWEPEPRYSTWTMVFQALHLAGDPVASALPYVCPNDNHFLRVIP